MSSRGLTDGLAGPAQTPSGRPAGGTPARFSIAIVADPALVRTVRLFAAAVARHGVPDDDPDEESLEGFHETVVEEVRLAVGEACALLMGGPGSPGGGEPAAVELQLALEDRLRVVVRAAGKAPLPDQPTGDVDGIEPWALLRGLLEDFRVTHDGGVTQVSMSWPLSH